MSWLFTNLTQNTPAVPFSTIGAQNVRIDLASQAVSKCAFTVAAPFDGPFLANFGDLCRITVSLREV